MRPTYTRSSGLNMLLTGFEREPSYSRPDPQQRAVAPKVASREPRLYGVPEGGPSGVAPRRPEAITAGMKGKTYRRRYANTAHPVRYTKALS